MAAMLTEWLARAMCSGRSFGFCWPNAELTGTIDPSTIKSRAPIEVLRRICIISPPSTLDSRAVILALKHDCQDGIGLEVTTLVFFGLAALLLKQSKIFGGLHGRNPHRRHHAARRQHQFVGA